MKFKLGKSLKNDYVFLLSLISFIIVLSFLIFFSIGPQSHRLINLEKILKDGINNFNLADSILLIIYGIIIIASLICFVKRFLYLKSFSNNCQTTIAKIVNINYIKDRCGVDVTFMFEGELCKKHFAIMNNSQTKYIHMDSEVELIIKDGNPKKSLIKELYFDNE